MIITFGYKHSDDPPDADLVFDVRDLPNPWQDIILRRLDGTDPRVVSYVLTHGGEIRAREIVQAIRNSPTPAPLTVAIGCSGGRHRSVVVARLVATLTGEVVEHRDFTPSLV